MLPGVYKQNSASSKYVVAGQANVAVCSEPVAAPMSLGAGEVKLILFCQSLTLILAARAGKKVFKRVRIHSVQ